MERNKVAKNCKSVFLDNGVEITYTEFGEENEEIIISSAIYIHTWSPVLEELGKKYHVYGFIMRLENDIETNWSRQWGQDLYDFCRALGIERFHYIGKCHSVIPGWFMAKEHPDMIQSFCSFYLVPHTEPMDDNSWMTIQKEEGMPALMKRAMRKASSLPIKMQELQTVGIENGFTPAFAKYGSCPEYIWDSKEELEEFMRTTEVPVCLMFGTDDILFHDHYSSNIKAMMNLNRARTVVLQGERHLMEIDAPKKIAFEQDAFINWVKLGDC